MGGGLKRVLQGAAGVGHAVVDTAVASVETAGGLVTSAAVAAASKTPVLKNIVKLYVHRCVCVCFVVIVGIVVVVVVVI